MPLAHVVLCLGVFGDGNPVRICECGRAAKYSNHSNHSNGIRPEASLRGHEAAGMTAADRTA